MGDISTAPITGSIKTQSVRIDTDLSDKEYYAVDFDGTDRNVVNNVADGNTQGFILVTAGDGSTNETTGVIVVWTNKSKISRYSRSRRSPRTINWWGVGQKHNRQEIHMCCCIRGGSFRRSYRC